MIVFLFTLFLKPFFACAQKTMIISISYMAQYMPTDQFQDRVLLLACRQTDSPLCCSFTSQRERESSAVSSSSCKSTNQLCLTLWDPMDCSPPDSFVHGILRARIQEWVAMPSSRGSSQPRDQTRVSCDSSTAGRFFTAELQGKPTLTVLSKPNYFPKAHF